MQPEYDHPSSHLYCHPPQNGHHCSLLTWIAVEGSLSPVLAAFDLGPLRFYPSPKQPWVSKSLRIKAKVPVVVGTPVASHPFPLKMCFPTFWVLCLEYCSSHNDSNLFPLWVLFSWTLNEACSPLTPYASCHIVIALLSRACFSSSTLLPYSRIN